MLDFVLERKSSQDLSASISDGRYAAQKWRMLRCGLANRLYLVELDGDCILPESRSKVLCSSWAGQCNTACMFVSGRGQKGADCAAQTTADACDVSPPSDWCLLSPCRQ